MSDSVQRYLCAAIAKRSMPGAAWWVGTESGPWSLGAVGQAELEPDPRPALPTTIYDLASLTKPLATAVLLLLLEQENVLELKMPVVELLPELSGSDHESSSLLELATHLAGLPAWRPFYLDAQGVESVLLEVAREPRTHSTEPLYSDVGYLCLGEAVARAAGTPLDRLFAERIAAPLGLRCTGYSTCLDLSGVAPTERANLHERALAGPRGRGYAWRDGTIRGTVHDVNAHALGGVAGHAGLFGTAEEVAVIALELLRPRELSLSDASRRKLLGEAVAGSGRTVGLVLARSSGAAQGALPSSAPGHVGFTGTSFWLDLERRSVYVLLTNRVHPTVAPEDFQPVRREFHRLAARLQ